MEAALPTRIPELGDGDGESRAMVLMKRSEDGGRSCVCV